jgi:hypothetical protein
MHVVHVCLAFSIFPGVSGRIRTDPLDPGLHNATKTSAMNIGTYACRRLAIQLLPAKILHEFSLRYR